MLLQFPVYKAGFTQHASPQQLFDEKLKEFKQHHYFRYNEDVNAILKHNETAQQLGKNQLSKTEVWEGLKGKARKPELYFSLTESTLVNVVENGNRFTRLSIQNSWVSGKDVVVQEDIFIDEKEQAVFFIGRNISFTPEELEKLLTHFHPSQLTDMDGNKPSLFHVIHRVHGEEKRPIVDWEMVLQSQQKEPFEQIESIMKTKTGVGIYENTIRQLQKQHSFPTLK